MDCYSQVIRCPLKRSARWLHLGFWAAASIGLTVALIVLLVDDSGSREENLFAGLGLFGAWAVVFLFWDHRFYAWVELDGWVVRAKRVLTRRIVEADPKDDLRIDSPYVGTLRLVPRKGRPRIMLVLSEFENVEPFLKAFADRFNRNRLVSQLYQPRAS